MPAAGKGPALGMHLGSARGEPGDGCWVHGHVHSPSVLAAASVAFGERQLGARGSTGFLPEFQTSQFLLGEFDCENVEWRLYSFPDQFIPTIYCLLQLESVPAF